MSQPPFDELLSAYLDGEVSAEERALVEQQLERSPADRELLDELSEVSESVRALPRPAAPPELAAAVLRKVRTQTALPLASSGAAASPSAAPEGGRRRRFRLAGFVAAVALVGIVLWMREPNGPGDGRDVAMDFGMPAASPRVASEASPKMKDAADGRIDPQQEGESLQDLLAMREQPLQRGEVLRTIYQNAGDTRVLMYTVVDVDRFNGSTQTLLARNGIEPVIVETAAEALTGRDRAFTGQNSSGLQTAVVYLEGDEVQLNQALDELESDPSIVEVGDFGTLAEVPGDYLAGNAAGVAGAAVAPLSTSVVADPQPSDDLKALSTEAASRLDAYRDPEESAEEDVAEEPAKHNVPAPAPAFVGGTEGSETQQADGDSPGAVRSRMQIPVPPETQPAERAITRASRSGAAPANMNNSYQVIVPEGDAEAVVQQLRNMTPRQSYQQNYRRNLRSAAPPPAVREPAIPEAAPAEADQRKSDAAGRVRVLIILQQPQAGGNSSQFAAPGQSPD